MEEKKIIKEVQLISTSNEYEINKISAILRGNNIPFIRRDKGVGAYINLSMGQSTQEKRIFINKDDYNKSLELISSIISNNSIEELSDDSDDEEQKENNKYNKRYILIRRVTGLLIIGLPILAVILLIISDIYNNLNR